MSLENSEKKERFNFKKSKAFFNRLLFYLAQIVSMLMTFGCHVFATTDYIDPIPRAQSIVGFSNLRLFAISTSIATISVGVGVFIKFFSMGESERVKEGNKIIRNAIIGWFMLNSFIGFLYYIIYRSEDTSNAHTGNNKTYTIIGTDQSLQSDDGEGVIVDYYMGIDCDIFVHSQVWKKNTNINTSTATVDYKWIWNNKKIMLDDTFYADILKTVETALNVPVVEDLLGNEHFSLKIHGYLRPSETDDYLFRVKGFGDGYSLKIKDDNGTRVYNGKAGENVTLGPGTAKTDAGEFKFNGIGVDNDVLSLPKEYDSQEGYTITTTGDNDQANIYKNMYIPASQYKSFDTSGCIKIRLQKNGKYPFELKYWCDKRSSVGLIIDVEDMDHLWYKYSRFCSIDSTDTSGNMHKSGKSWVDWWAYVGTGSVSIFGKSKDPDYSEGINYFTNESTFKDIGNTNSNNEVFYYHDVRQTRLGPTCTFTPTPSFTPTSTPTPTDEVEEGGSSHGPGGSGAILTSSGWVSGRPMGSRLPGMTEHGGYINIFWAIFYMLCAIKLALFMFATAAMCIAAGISGFMKMFSMGNQRQIEQAKILLKASIIGWLVVSAFYLILDFFEPRAVSMYSVRDTIFTLAIMAMPVAVGIGGFMRIFAVGNRERIERANTLIKASLITWFFLMTFMSFLYYISPTDIEPPTSPSKVTATTISNSEVSLTWTASTDNESVLSYSIYRDGVKVGTVNYPVTTFVDSSLTPNRGYNYKILATDTSKNNSPFSSDVEATTGSLVPPTNVALLDSTIRSLKIGWDRANNTVSIESYDVHREPVWLSGDTVVVGREFTDTGLTHNTSYSYIVRAKDEYRNFSPWTESVMFKTVAKVLNKPINVSITDHALYSLRINWEYDSTGNNVDVYAYRVYRVGKTESIGDVLATSPLRSVTDSGLSYNTQYSYRIKAIDNDGFESELTQALTGSTLNKILNKPTNVQASNNLRTSLVVTWGTPVPGSNVDVSYYKVYRNDTCIKTVNSSETRSVTDDNGGIGLAPRTTYIYKVKAFDNANFESDYSDTASFTTLDYISTPTNLSSTSVTDTSVTFTWTGSNEATSYEIYRTQNPNGVGTYIGMSSSTSYTDSNLSANSTYYYTVKAKSTTNESLMSGKLKVDTMLVTPTGFTLVSRTDTSIEISWGAVSAATSYEVYRDGGTTPIGTPGANSFQDTGLSGHTSYSYKVKAKSQSRSSDYSSPPFAVTSMLGKPTGVTVGIATVSSLPLSWTAPTVPSGISISSYKIYRDSAKTTWVSTVNAPTTNYTDSGLSAGTSYNYYITALDSDGCESPVSQVGSGTTLAKSLSAPGSLSADNSIANKITLSWQASTGNVSVAKYQVYVDNGTTPVAEPIGTSWTEIGLGSVTSRNYKVYAVDSAGFKSSYSEVTCSITKPVLLSSPSNLSFPIVSTTGLTLSWNTVSGANKYKVYYNNNGGSVETTNCEYSFSGLTSNKLYTYEVCAVDIDGNEGSRSSVSRATNIAKPVITVFNKRPKLGAVDINWAWDSGGNYLDSTCTNGDLTKPVFEIYIKGSNDNSWTEIANQMGLPLGTDRYDCSPNGDTWDVYVKLSINLYDRYGYFKRQLVTADSDIYSKK